MRFYFLKLILYSLVLGVFWSSSQGNILAQELSGNYHDYLSPGDLNKALNDLHKKFPKQTKLINLANSAGDRNLQILEIGSEVGLEKKSLPAVLVVANMEGTVPISSMAAVYLADYILSSGKAPGDLTWYVLPCGNPDAYSHYFETPLRLDPRNNKAHNDDMDELTDEDAYNDLDGNGIITQMRVKDPEGTWIPVNGDPRMLRKADANKGEKGIYKLYSEGLDDDGDGKYNEDGSGGVNVGINFPHLFKPFTETSGLWPGCTEESFQLMKFVFEHPEIAMTMNFGASNFCIVAPKAGRKAGVDMDKIKIPENMAKGFGADPNRTYTIQEVIDLVQPMVPAGMTVTESMVASFLGLGAVVNPLEGDLKFYKELSDQYKEYLKDKGLEAERLDPQSAKDGSFELWSYYHLGIPSFTMDFWTLPEVKEEKKEESGISIKELEKMSSEDFIALGEEKIALFLKESGAPDQFKAENVIKMIESGQVDPKQMAGMMKDMPKPKDEKEGDPKTKALLAYSDDQLEGKGFVDWAQFKHPTLGDVEIGGVVPFVDNTPPKEIMDSLFSLQVPWVLELSNKLPRLSIMKSEVKPKGAGVYELIIWVENESYLAFPTAMGKKNQQPAPAIVEIKGNNINLLSGKKRTAINDIEGLKVKKLSWLIETEKGVNLNVKLSSVFAWGDEKQIKIGGVK